MTVFESESTFVTLITLSKVRETLVPVAVAAVLRVTVVPETETAATVVPDAIPVPETESPTLIDAEDEVKVTLMLPEVVLPVVVTAVEKASLVTVCPTLTSETSDTIKLLALVNVTLAEVRLDVVFVLSVTVLSVAVVLLTETTVVPSANPLDDVTTAPVTIEEAVDAETVSWVAAVLAVIAVATVVLVTIKAVTVICVSA